MTSLAVHRPERPTVIRHGRVLDVTGHAAPPADLLIDRGVIVEIGPPGMPAPADAQELDATHRLIHPGLVNAHTHGHGNLAKGFGDLWTLELLLTANPWIGGHRTAEDKYLGSYIGALEMLMKGCTACYDLTAEFPVPTVEGLQACAQAYQDAGLRVVLAPMVATRSFFEAIPGLLDALPAGLRREVERFRQAPGEASIQAMETVLRNWRFDRDRVRPALAPTVPHHCDDDFMLACAHLAREHGCGLHSHIQESKVQVVAGRTWYGMTQTAHLDRLGLLGPDFVAAHGVWLDTDDMRRLRDRGASVAHNPGSNMRLGNGIAAVREMLDLGLNVGIGTDGANCSDNLNMYEAMRAASLGSKVRGPHTTTWLRTEEVVHAATEGSARALGWTGCIGRIAPGYQADLVLLDLTHPNWIPLNDATNQLVHTEDGNAVHTVMVGGRVVVEGGRPVGVDLAALARRAEQARERLQSLNVDNQGLYRRLAPVVNSFCPGLACQPLAINRFADGVAACPHPMPSDPA